MLHKPTFIGSRTLDDFVLQANRYLRTTFGRPCAPNETVELEFRVSLSAQKFKKCKRALWKMVDEQKLLHKEETDHMVLFPDGWRVCVPSDGDACVQQKRTMLKSRSVHVPRAQTDVVCALALEVDDDQAKRGDLRAAAMQTVKRLAGTAATHQTTVALQFPTDRSVYRRGVVMLQPLPRRAVDVEWKNMSWMRCRTRPHDLFVNRALPGRGRGRARGAGIPFGAVTFAPSECDVGWKPPDNLRLGGDAGPVPVMVRQRKRMSVSNRKYLVIDLTQITTEQQGCSYELEIEALRGPEGLDSGAIADILKRLLR
jgi:hypothetical protein